LLHLGLVHIQTPSCSHLEAKVLILFGKETPGLFLASSRVYSMEPCPKALKGNDEMVYQLLCRFPFAFLRI